MKLFWVCAGGAFGSGSRYLVSLLALRLFGTSFPGGTFFVNLVGSFLLCLLMELGLSSEALTPTIRITLATGFLGGFTTYSTFNYETINYLRDGAWLVGALNILLTVSVCLLAGYAGIMTAHALAR